MGKFRVELRFTGIPVEEAKRVLEEAIPRWEVTADGFWHIIEDEDTRSAIIDGKLVWHNDGVGLTTGGLEVVRNAGKLVSPLIKVSDLTAVVMVMNKLYDAGAVVMSDGCVKIHFLKRYSPVAAARIVNRLAKKNELLHTMLFFPRLLAPLWTPVRDDNPDEALQTEIVKHYKEIINGISWDDRNMELTSKLVASLIRGNTIPDKPEVYKTRFDADSSPDSDPESDVMVD